MYKDYNMTQHTLLMETSVLISTNDISRHVNDIAETIHYTEFDEFRHPRGFIYKKSKAQRAENHQNYKRQFLYYFNRNCLYLLILTFCPSLFFYSMLSQ